ncbi:uncharacterized protein [Rutidosis leptorrhynchoides]|uniref:uncharacterized protein n=1 Tax=Rutidosis leptorrhynchoides TaxID=125765 RepID=UPI003A998CF2
MKDWDVVDVNSLLCSLCKLQHDSHNHLFFECKFSLEVWERVKRLIDFPSIGNKWKEIVQQFVPVAKRKVARVIVAKIVFAATVYFVWQEHNARLFRGESRNLTQVFNIIFGTVRLKLMSVKFKESPHVHKLKMAWKI